MATISLLVSDSVAAKQTKINAAVAGDTIEFQTGTHNFGPSEFLRIIGSADGAAAITYKPAAAGVVLYKNPDTKTEHFFKSPSSTPTKSHNVVFDGSVGGVADMVFDGAGIDVRDSPGVTMKGWKIQYVKATNFYGANVAGASVYTSRWFPCTQNLNGLEFHHNIHTNSVNGSREGYVMEVYLRPGCDNWKIHHNSGNNVWQYYKSVVQASRKGGAEPVKGFEFYANVIDGIARACLEHDGGPDDWCLNAQFYDNVIKNWRADSPVPLDTYGLSVVCDGAIGTQIYNNLIDGGGVRFPADTYTGADKYGVRLGIEMTEECMNTFGNIVTGCKESIRQNPGPYQTNCYIYANATCKWQWSDISSGMPLVYMGVNRAPDGSPALPTATATVAGGKITALTLTGGGGDWRFTHSTTRKVPAPPRMNISGDGTGAWGVAVVNPDTGAVNRLIIMNQGTGYTSATVSFTKGSVADSNRSNQSTCDTSGSVDNPPPAPTVIDESLPTGNYDFLSDVPSIWLTDAASVNGWGPYELDMSNGEDAAGDGHTMVMTWANNTHRYSKGVGAHGGGTLKINLQPGAYTNFKATIGIDDEVVSVMPGLASVTFYKNSLGNSPFFQTSTFSNGQAGIDVDLDISDAGCLYIVFDAHGDLTKDHINLAFARLEKAAVTPGGEDRVTCVSVDASTSKVTTIFESGTKRVETLL